MNIIEKLLDENNSDDIILYNENNEAIAFEQIATIYLGEEPFFILHPVEEVEGVAEDEALVFGIAIEDGEEVLDVVDNDDIVDAVFDEYYSMLEEAGVDVD